MVALRPRMVLAALTAGCLALAGCGGSSSSSDTTDAPVTAPPATDAPPATEAPPATDAPPATEPAAPAIELCCNDSGFQINWSSLAAEPFYGETGGSDPYFHIHNIPAADGFYFSLELYTVYGSTWTGELGTFDIGCAPASTGICAHFDPDGPGPLPNLGDDFLATGNVTINQLDAEGYDVVVNELVFSDGTQIIGLHLVG